MKKLAKILFITAMSLFLIGIVCPLVILNVCSEGVYSASAKPLELADGNMVLKDKYSDKVKEAEQKRNEARDKKNKLENETKQLQKEADEIQAYIQEMDQKQNDTVLEMQQTLAELERVTDEFNQATVELEEAEKALAEQYESMKKRVQYIYENGQIDELAMYAKSQSISDVLNASEYIKRINEYDRELLENYAKSKDAVTERRNILAVQKEEMDIAAEMYQMDLDYCEEVIAAKNAAIDKYNEKIGANEEILETYIADLATAQKSLDQAVAEQQAYIRQQEEIRRKQEEEARKKAMEAAAKTAAAQQNNKATSGLDNAKDVAKSNATNLNQMIWPLPGDYRTASKYGPRVPPCKGASSFHQGWDIGGNFGAQVVAVLAGKVTGASYNSSAGNYVVIDHGNGYSTHYMHFSQILVKVGQTVQQGDVIGLVGSTGVSTAPHLHFGLYYKGSSTDPAPYLHP